MKRKPSPKRLPSYLNSANVYVPLIDKVKHSVVSISLFHSRKKISRSGLLPWWYGSSVQEELPEAANMGSGFVIHPRGYILTNEHVIRDFKDIRVKFCNGWEVSAKPMWTDEKNDLAIIKIPSTKSIRPLPFGSSERSKVGEIVISIGNPMGLEHTITTGIISAKNRKLIKENRMYEDLIQTDCAINPGNSGGPLINLNGEVIGINAFMAKNNQGLGFSMGIDRLKGLIRRKLKELIRT